MKKVIYLFALATIVFTAGFFLVARGDVSPSDQSIKNLPVCATDKGAASEASGSAFVWRKESNSAFLSKEKLNFDVAWLFVVVGYASLEVRGIEGIDGRPCYHIYSEAHSAAFFDAFYKVRNTNESWMDTEALCSLKYLGVSDEKDTKKTETLIIDQVNHKFKIVEKDKSGPTCPWVQDVLSSLYYIRTKNLAEGQEFVLDTQSGDSSWPLKVKVVREETVEVPAGRFKCFVLEPAVREGAGIFQAKGKLTVWVTADSKKTPVLMRSQIAVGSIEARLRSME